MPKILRSALLTSFCTIAAYAGTILSGDLGSQVLGNTTGDSISLVASNFSLTGVVNLSAAVTSGLPSCPSNQPATCTFDFTHSFPNLGGTALTPMVNTVTYNGVTYAIGLSGGYLVNLSLNFSSSPATVPTSITVDPLSGNIQTDAQWNNIPFTATGTIQLTTLSGSVIFSDSLTGSGLVSGFTEQNSIRSWDQTFDYQFTTSSPEPGSLALIASAATLLLLGKRRLRK